MDFCDGSLFRFGEWVCEPMSVCKYVCVRLSERFHATSCSGRSRILDRPHGTCMHVCKQTSAWKQQTHVGLPVCAGYARVHVSASTQTSLIKEWNM